MRPTGEIEGIGFGFLRISAPDGRDHLVDDRVLATSPEGHFLARCGEYVVSTSLGEPPGRPCPVCMPRPARSRRAPSGHPAGRPSVLAPRWARALLPWRWTPRRRGPTERSPAA